MAILRAILPERTTGTPSLVQFSSNNQCHCVAIDIVSGTHHQPSHVTNPQLNWCVRRNTPLLGVRRPIEASWLEVLCQEPLFSASHPETGVVLVQRANYPRACAVWQSVHW